MMSTSGDRELLALITDLRRQLHQLPEIGHHEWRSAALIESALRQLGLDPFRPANTSVAVIVGPRGRCPRLGFRADLDAIRITESNEVPYRSQIAGLMHACGHDGHAAALVGLAREVANLQLDQAVLLVFQQGEEASPSGAPLVLDGLPKELTPPEFYAFHLWPQLPEHVIGTRVGPMLAAVAGVDIMVTGRRGRAHGIDCGAESIDALAAGIELYRRLSERLPAGRTFEAGAANVLALGMLQGGEAPNLAALNCRLRGTLRSRSWQSENCAADQLRATADEVAGATGTEIVLRLESGIRPPVINDRRSVERVQDACRVLGLECRSYPQEPVGVSDDFGWYVDGRAGALIFVGCGWGDVARGLHESSFDFRESVLLTPIRIGVELARQACIYDT